MKWWPWIVGGTVVAGIGAAILYVVNVGPGGRPADRTQVMTLTHGSGYHIASIVGSGIETEAQLIAALNTAGWIHVTLEGESPNGIHPGNSYQVYGVWNGQDGTSVPQGATITSAPYGANTTITVGRA